MNILTRPKRQFLTEDFLLNSWDDLKEYFEDLKSREILSLEDLLKFLKDRSELESFLEEDFAWKYIAMNCDTEDETKKQAYLFFVQEIQPKISPLDDILNKKIYNSKFSQNLPENYQIYLRGLKSSIEIFREKNVPIFTKLEAKAQEFGKISAKMEIEHNGKKITLQKAKQLLESTNRNLRETIFKKISEERLSNKNKLDELLNELIAMRHEVALNADFDNFRDYKFVAMGRFDYTPADCEKFHEAVKTEILPFIKKLHQTRKTKLGLEILKPWDLSVDIYGDQPLKPFENSSELLDKTIRGFAKLNPKFGEFLEIMKNMKHFDLDARKGKAPGGFNYPLYEIGAPFIFMNSVGTQRDLETMVHEGGHAIHSFLVRELDIADLKSTPSEVAELASQAMELMSMDFWKLFYENNEDLVRAKRKKLENSLTILPWVCMIDKFQHWLYVNPKHTKEKRQAVWLEISREFSTGEVDYSDFEEVLANQWQNQLHIFEVPFYYIEYGFSQLGAIALWKNFRKNKTQALTEYQDFMKLGYTKSIPEIYKTAGISFDFSQEYLRELIKFLEEELERF
jgi:oligoendopeptidase F